MGLGGYNDVTHNNVKQKNGAWLNAFGGRTKNNNRVEEGGAEEFSLFSYLRQIHVQPHTAVVLISSITHRIKDNVRKYRHCFTVLFLVWVCLCACVCVQGVRTTVFRFITITVCFIGN